MYTKINRARQLRFLVALAKSGRATSAAVDAHVDMENLEEARRIDGIFAREWEVAERAAAAYRLEQEAWRRAVDGTPEPVVSDGKVVRDDAGQPLSTQRYSDALLIELLKANRVRKFPSGGVWKAAIGSRQSRRLALIIVIGLIILIAGGAALQWGRNHFFFASFN